MSLFFIAILRLGRRLNNSCSGIMTCCPDFRFVLDPVEYAADDTRCSLSLRTRTLGFPSFIEIKPHPTSIRSPII